MRYLAFLFLVIGTINGVLFTSVRAKHQHLNDGKPRNFDDLWQQFLAFIPFDEELKLIDSTVATDPEVKAAIDYLYSASFASEVDKVDNTPLWPVFLKFMYDSGVEEIYTYINKIHEILKLPPYTPPASHSRRASAETGVLPMFNRMLRILPREDILKWFDEVVSPDPVFQFFLSRMRSPEFNQLSADIGSTPEYIAFKATLKNQGMDTAAMEDAIVDFVRYG